MLKQMAKHVTWKHNMESFFEMHAGLMPDVTVTKRQTGKKRKRVEEDPEDDSVRPHDVPTRPRGVIPDFVSHQHAREYSAGYGTYSFAAFDTDEALLRDFPGATNLRARVEAFLRVTTATIS